MNNEFTNYDECLHSMSLERMALLNVRLIIVNNSEPFYVTSTGQLFNFKDLNSAITYETEWLKKPCNNPSEGVE